MLFLLLNLHVLSKEHVSNNNQSGKLPVNAKSNLSSIRLLAYDSVKCLESYTAALNALKAVTTRSKLDLKDGEQAANSALDDFKAQCALKATAAVAGDCGTFLTDLTVEPGLDDDFTAVCAITAPTANAADCQAAYDALVDTIVALPSSKNRLISKATAPEALNTFVTKCGVTAHTKSCYDGIKDINVNTGPTKTNLEAIQSNCNPSPQTGGGSGDSELFSFTPNIKILAFISIFFYIWF
jgi:hypothetical protein